MFPLILVKDEDDRTPQDGPGPFPVLLEKVPLSHPLPQQCSGGTEFLPLTLKKEIRSSGSHREHLRTGMLLLLGCRSPQQEHPPAPGVTVPVTFLQSPSASGEVPGAPLGSRAPTLPFPPWAHPGCSTGKARRAQIGNTLGISGRDNSSRQGWAGLD